MEVAEQNLETFDPSEATPPARDFDSGGYVCPPEKCTWELFQYASPSLRRATVKQFFDAVPKNSLPAMKIWLIGGPSSGKGTIAPMLSQAFRVRTIGVGALLRAEKRVGTPRALACAATMARGELIPDELALEVLTGRLGNSYDIASNGFLIDGFPRTASQVAAVLEDPRWAALRPDCVISLVRPEELIKEFALGRCADSATGQTYHPVYAPPPEEVRDRLVWRIDDTTEVVEARVRSFLDSEASILAALKEASVPVLRAENARSELATFAEVADFVQSTAMSKLDTLGRSLSSLEMEGAVKLFVDERDSDIAPFCAEGEGEDACIVRYEDEVEEAEVPPLLAAVLRCNTYDPDEYVPVVVAAGGDGAAMEQVGWANPEVLEALAPQLAAGKTCALVELTKRRGTYRLASAPPGDAPSGGEGVVGGEWGGGGERRRVSESPLESYQRSFVGIQLAPEVKAASAMTDVAKLMVDDLVLDGLIPAAKVRGELQDVTPLPRGFGGAGFGAPALLRLERAAMIYFGVPSFGIHVNGWVRDPTASDGRPYAMWVAKRSMSKATYPGLFDQMVAGGQPSGISFMENVRKECEEEASLPPEVVAAVRPAGLVSYRYTTRKGLSTKVLAAYDVEMPSGLVPICADGEVEEFVLLPIREVLQSIRDKLPLWKPNSALIVVDFAVRHGFVSPDEPGFVEIIHLLRAGGFGSE